MEHLSLNLIDNDWIVAITDLSSWIKSICQCILLELKGGCTICTPSTKRSCPFISLRPLNAQTALSDETAVASEFFRSLCNPFLQRRANKSCQKSFCHGCRELASILQLWNIRGIFSTSIQSVVFSQVLHSPVFWVLRSEGRYIADIHQCNTQIPGEFKINNRSLLILLIWWKESTHCSDYDSCFPLRGRRWHHGILGFGWQLSVKHGDVSQLHSHHPPTLILQCAINFPINCWLRRNPSRGSCA